MSMAFLRKSNAALMRCWAPLPAPTLNHPAIVVTSADSSPAASDDFMSTRTGQSVCGSPAVSSYSLTLCMTLDNSYYKGTVFCTALDFPFLLQLRRMESLKCWVSVFSQCFHYVLCADFEGWYWLIMFGVCQDTAASKEPTGKVA